ncbi:MAG: addiction module protein [Planctomycetaceae bacterium]|nr:addiction module protein [Planctomycetaceae bacterium]
MSPNVEKLLKDALALPDGDQLALVSALTAAVEERGLRPFDDAWLKEIGRRSDEYDSGAVKTIPWADVKAQARSQDAQH